MAVLAAGGGPARAGGLPTTGELRLLVVLANFPDRPMAHERSYFTGNPEALVDRLVAYYTEVSSGRLTLVPHVGGPVVTLPEAVDSEQYEEAARFLDLLRRKEATDESG